MHDSIHYQDWAWGGVVSYFFRDFVFTDLIRRKVQYFVGWRAQQYSLSRLRLGWGVWVCSLSVGSVMLLLLRGLCRRRPRGEKGTVPYRLVCTTVFITKNKFVCFGGRGGGVQLLEHWVQHTASSGTLSSTGWCVQQYSLPRLIGGGGGGEGGFSYWNIGSGFFFKEEKSEKWMTVSVLKQGPNT